MKSLILFLLAFLILISSCQQQRPNILAPDNIITDPEINYITNYVTNVITNNAIIVITLDYINSQIPALSFEVPNTPDDVRKCLLILYINQYQLFQKELHILN